MIRLFLKFYWKIFGWKIVGNFPYQYKKLVLAIAPHTHWFDIMVGFASRNALNIRHAKFLAKKELFVGPLGWLLKWLGGTPVDRHGKLGMVGQTTALFNANENFILGLAPEGTRKKVNTLKTGFYHIAKAAAVPIVPIGFDYENKELVVGEAFFTSDDENADIKKLIAFYAKIKGKQPANDLRHLR